MALLLLTATSAHTAQPAGQVAELIGIAEVQSGDSETAPWRPLRFGDDIMPGDTIRTQAGTKAKLIFVDQSVMTIGPGTRLRIDENVYQTAPTQTRTSIFSLFQGKVRSLVSKFFDSSASNRFEVRTPSAVAGVRGTEFVTSVDAEGNTDIVVFDGVVEVFNRRDRQRRAVFLGQGMGSRVQSDRTPSAPRQLSQQQLDNVSNQMDISGGDALLGDESGDAASGALLGGNSDDLAGLGAENGGGGGGGDGSGTDPGGDDSSENSDLDDTNSRQDGFDDGFDGGSDFANGGDRFGDDILTGRLTGQDVNADTRVQIDVDFR